MSEFIVGTKLREKLKGMGYNTAGDAAEGLDVEVSRLIEKAADRTKANGRKTVRAVDF